MSKDTAPARTPEQWHDALAPGLRLGADPGLPESLICATFSLIVKIVPRIAGKGVSDQPLDNAPSFGPEYQANGLVVGCTSLMKKRARKLGSKWLAPGLAR